MQTVQLHHTDLTVSRLCMGTGNFGTVLTEQQAHAHLDRFFDLGSNLIDTAHVYNDWVPGEKSRSEKIIGRWLKKQRREDVVLCTKGGHFSFDARDICRVTPKELRVDLAQSLDYLQTDYVDVYMLHRDNPDLPVSEIMDCLDEFVSAGHAHYIACSNWSAQRTAEANTYARAHGKTPFVINELMWSMARPNRDALPPSYVAMDEDMMQLGEETQLNFMCFTSLAQGYLTKRYAGRPISESLHRSYDSEENERLIAGLRSLDSAQAVTHASLQYFARQRVVAVPIVAFSGMEQLDECADAFR